MRIAIACAERLRVEALRQLVAGLAGHELAWIAQHGAAAVELCAGNRPDLILLDLDLPGPGVVDVIRGIRGSSTTSILLLVEARPDASRPEELRRLFEAMGLGALDFAVMPRLDADGQLRGAAALAKKILTLEPLLSGGAESEPQPAQTPPGPRPILVALGASSGGPRALASILRGLPRELDAAVLIVQHIEPAYVAGLASWLQQDTGFAVAPAAPGTMPRTGRALLAASSEHLVLAPDGTVAYSAEPRDAVHHPSIDVFFGSLASHALPGIAVLLSSPGRDGAEGLLHLHRAGWAAICQDERLRPASGRPAEAPFPPGVLALPLEAIAPTLAAAVAKRMRLR